MAHQRVLPSVRAQFRAMAGAFVPEARDLTAEQWARAEARVETALAPRPDPVKRQLRLFLRLADWSAVARFGQPLTSLDPERRLRWLRTLERSPLPLLRRGLWGVRTLAFMAYYGLPEVRSEIGYRGDPGGWSARRGGAGVDRPAGSGGLEGRGTP